MCIYIYIYIYIYIHREKERLHAITFPWSEASGIRTIFLIFIQLGTAALRLIVRSWLDVPTFGTRRLHACHQARAPSGERWNCEREMSGNCAEITTSTPFRDCLHAVKLRHETNGFTSPPKEGVLRIFFALKIRRLWPCANPRTWVPKVSTLPLDHRSRWRTDKNILRIQ
jgi:hypothetical protein